MTQSKTTSIGLIVYYFVHNMMVYRVILQCIYNRMCVIRWRWDYNRINLNTDNRYYRIFRWEARMALYPGFTVHLAGITVHLACRFVFIFIYITFLLELSKITRPSTSSQNCWINLKWYFLFTKSFFTLQVLKHVFNSVLIFRWLHWRLHIQHQLPRRIQCSPTRTTQWVISVWTLYYFCGI